MRALAILSLLLLNVLPQGPDPLAAIDAAKRAIVGDLDPALPRLTVDDWLRELVGPQAVVTWNVNDCGEQTGDPAADRGRDFPVCAEARVALPGNRILGLSLAVGTQRRGITDPIGFWSGYMAGPRPNQMVWFKTLAEVPRQPRISPQAQEKAIAVSGRVLDEEGGPVPGARVRVQVQDLRPLDVVTDETGRFLLDIASPGRVWLVASHPDFGLQGTGGSGLRGPHWNGYSYSGPLPRVAVDLVLRRGLVLRGRVLDSSGRAFAGEDIYLVPSYMGSGPWGFTTSTDADGTFVFERAVLSTFELVPRSLDHWHPRTAGEHLRIRQAPDSWLAAAEAGASVDLRLEVFTLLSMKLNVSALQSATVQVWKRWGRDSTSGTTDVDADGRVQLLMEQGVEHEVWVVPERGRPVAPWTTGSRPDWVGTPEQATELPIGPR